MVPLIEGDLRNTLHRLRTWRLYHWNSDILSEHAPEVLGRRAAKKLQVARSRTTKRSFSSMKCWRRTVHYR